MTLNQVRKNMLVCLYEHYPDYIDNEKIISKVSISPDELRKEISFLEEEGLIVVEWFLGGGFLAKITSLGINELEQEQKPPKKISEKEKIAKVEHLQDIVIKLKRDIQNRIDNHEKKMNELDQRLDDFYAKLITIFGVFAAILALVSFTGAATFNSNFNIWETFILIVGFGISLGIFILVLNYIVKTR